MAFRDRDPYYAQAEGYAARGGERWDSERFAAERDRTRFGGGRERERFEERDVRSASGRVRERSVDDIYERRGPRGFEEDRYERREYYDEPRFERERPAPRERYTIEKEREREVYSPPPPLRRPARPGFMRRQSSLDTFDRKPLTRYVEREEYGPPARYREELRAPPPLTPIPLPRTRGLPPPRRFVERDYEDIEVAEPDFYGDDYYRGYPERVREREIIRTRRPSRSRERSRERSTKGSTVAGSVRSSSTSSSEETTVSVKNEFPKKGKTRMPARLVNKRAITDLGYEFEEENETVIILKALGRENIDEVIKLSEDYKVSETKIEAHSEAGTIIEERREEVITISPPHPPQEPEIVEETRSVRSVSQHSHHSPHSHHHHNPVIIDAGPRFESSDPIPIGPLALAIPDRSRKMDERTIRAEIKALEAEKEALRSERRAEKEMRRADRIRRDGHGRYSETDLVLFSDQRIEGLGEEYTVVRKEKLIEEPEGGVRIEKDKKVPPPKLIRAMLKTLT